MKSASARKWTAKLFPVVLLFLMILAVRPVCAAETDITTVKLTRSNFGVSYIGDDHVSIDLELPYNNIQAEVRLYEGAKLIGKTTAYTYASIDAKVKKNKTYFYRVRPVYKGEYIGPWSARKAFSTVMLKLKPQTNDGLKMRVKVPKMSGVKSVKLQLSSTSSSSGYKTWKTVKPGKTKYCSSANGKAFVKYKTYYIRAKVTLKNGVPCESVYYQRFYFYNK